MTTSSRLLRLLSLLQARRDWPGGELARRLQVSARTVRRDVDRLRQLGYPVEATTGPAGGYRLRAGTAMPPLLLDDDEAVAIAVGLRTAARASVTGIEETAVRALVKLEQVLPSHLRRRVHALGTVTSTLAAPGPTIDPETLTVIAGACRDAERLRFAYRDRDGVGSRRRVEPHSLVTIGRRWYLVAFCCERQDWRSFRLDRLSGPAADGTRFAPRTLPAADPAAFVAAAVAGAPSRYAALVTFHAPAAEVARRAPHLAGVLEPLDAARCRCRIADDSLDWLVVRLGFLDIDFEVHEPPELRDHLRAVAGRLGRAAGRAAPPAAPIAAAERVSIACEPIHEQDVGLR